MNLRFTEAARGVNKDININVVDTCPKCVGSRCEPGTKSVKCTYCNGTGMETFSRGNLLILTLRKPPILFPRSEISVGYLSLPTHCRQHLVYLSTGHAKDLLASSSFLAKL